MSLRSFEPCNKMPIIDFLKREFGDKKIFVRKGNGFILKKSPPERKSESFWDEGYGTEDRYLSIWDMLNDMLGIDRNPPCMRTEDDLPDDIIVVNEEQAKLLKRCTITIDPEIADQDTGVRKPYYRIRGKQVTNEQRKLVENTVDFNWEKWSTRHLANFSNNFFNSENEIISNAITRKYPYIGEYIDDALFLAMRFPFLDLIIAVTGWNECPEEAWEKLLSDEEKYSHDDEDEWDFENNIDIGIYVHRGNVELLNPEHTRQIYSKYDKTIRYDFSTLPGSGSLSADDLISEPKVWRKDVSDKLPEAFDKCFLPEDAFNDDDTIEFMFRISYEMCKSVRERPYGFGENWTNSSGRKRIAIVKKQGELLSKYLNFNIKFVYNFGHLCGFVLKRHWITSEPNKYMKTGINVTPEGKTAAKITYDIHEYIRDMNMMIREYLVWCYERRINPYYYNIIPLCTGEELPSGIVSHTDLDKLFVTDKTKDVLFKKRNVLEFIRFVVVCKNSYDKNCLEVSCSKSEINNGNTQFEGTPVISFKFSDINKNDELGIINIRIDKNGAVCMSVETAFNGEKQIRLYDSKFSVPSAFSTAMFCLMDPSIISLLLKKAVEITGIKRSVYKVVIPVLRNSATDPCKKYGKYCIFRVRMKNGEINQTYLTAFEDYLSDRGI